jgi:hypothetical protein
VTKRLDGLLDEPRPGPPRRVSDADVERPLTRTLDSTRPDATHWGTRTLARSCKLSLSTVSRVWRAFALQPHLSEIFKPSRDPLSIEKVRDIVGLYLHPPDKALVLCVDEKSQIQPLDPTQPPLPMRPGKAERSTHDNMRRGTTSLFAALDVKVGVVIEQRHRRHRALELCKFLRRIDAAAPAARPASDHRQIRDPQDASRPPLAAPASPPPPALPVAQRVVDQLRRAPVRHADPAHHRPHPTVGPHLFASRMAISG